MAFRRVCSLDDVWEGDMEAFEVDGTEVLVIHLPGGTVHAIQSLCPHQEVDLADGELEDGVLTCSMHLWQFDVASGKGVNPSHAEVAKYPVKLEGDDVYVDVEGVEPKFASA